MSTSYIQAVEEVRDRREADRRRLAYLEARVVWRTIDSAPTDGTPLILFARCKTATASAIVIGWHLPDLGWIECSFTPNHPIGLVPTHWLPLPEFPR